MNKNYNNAFNEDIFLQKSFKDLVEKYSPELIIETGTYKGDTTEYLASFNIPVISIEVNKEYYDSVSVKLKDHNNLKLYHGDSPSVLSKIFPEIKNKKIIAFLDAHWLNDMALERELELFSELAYKPVVLIHDFFVPHSPDLGYDTHDNHRYDYEFYKPYFDKLYGEGGYNFYYNKEATGLRRGVIFLEPK